MATNLPYCITLEADASEKYELLTNPRITKKLTYLIRPNSEDKATQSVKYVTGLWLSAEQNYLSCFDKTLFALFRNFRRNAAQLL